MPFLNNGGSPVQAAMLLLIIPLSGVAHAQIDDVTLTGNAQSVPGIETLAKSPFPGPTTRSHGDLCEQRWPPFGLRWHSRRGGRKVIARRLYAGVRGSARHTPARICRREGSVCGG